jgi:glycerol transport system ATP-binding protein
VRSLAAKGGTLRCSSIATRPALAAASSSGWRLPARSPKNAPLMLLDEPLVNLDYKLREELRDELTQLFVAGDSTVVLRHHGAGARLCCWAATPPSWTRGSCCSTGRTAEVFHAPSVAQRVARAFSDPPMNLTCIADGGARWG